jgi:hypothetical protein
MDRTVYEFTRVHTYQEVAALMQQTEWDFPYWPEFDDDLENEAVMDFVMTTIEYRQCLPRGFMIREGLLDGTQIVERSQIERTMTECLQKLDSYELSVYTVTETIPITAVERHTFNVHALVMHIRHGRVNRLSAPLNLSVISEAYISEELEL